jgi:plasmid maintenance system antidote protein VapI
MMTAVTSWPYRLRIDQLVSGKRAMKANTALRLEQCLGVEAAFWMNLQKRHELELATEKYAEKIKKTVQRVPLRLLFKSPSLN